MRHFVLLIILVIFASGCGVRTTRTTSTVNTQKGSGDSASASDDFAGRLAAAKSIYDSNKRDAALAKVALDAAEAGDGETTKLAVTTMFSTNAKDDACYNAAVALARAGKGKEAKAVADMMFSTNRKDEAMSKIAGGGE